MSLHWVRRTLVEDVPYPDHAPRKASTEYRQVHHRLVVVLDEPCWICGVRRSTLGDPASNPNGAKQMETHHWHLEHALANAVDEREILADFPEIGAADDPHLREWLDSEHNMLVLCDRCHRGSGTGIHMISYPVWVAQRWMRDDFPKLKAT